MTNSKQHVCERTNQRPAQQSRLGREERHLYTVELKQIKAFVVSTNQKHNNENEEACRNCFCRSRRVSLWGRTSLLNLFLSLSLCFSDSFSLPLSFVLSRFFLLLPITNKTRTRGPPFFFFTHTS